VLPPVEVVMGCRFRCDPIAPDPECPDGPHGLGAPSETRAAQLCELPISATEDRLVGALDIERALTEGVKSFEPGLLASAHRGVLYVDEVNLLHDHLVDLLLDAAALGTSYVERDGISVRHAARFLLVGTMNPEEGELRPQLLDRFGLTVEVAAPKDASSRAEVVRRRLAFDIAPEAFVDRFAAAEGSLAADIARARKLVRAVDLPDEMLEKIAEICAAFGVDGLRADIVIARTASAHAAWRGRLAVEIEDIGIAARLALPHRRRRNPFDAPGLDEEQLEELLSDACRGETDPDLDPDDDVPPSGGSGRQEPEAGESESKPESSATAHQESEPSKPEQTAAPGNQDQVVAPAEAFHARRLEIPGLGSGAPGRRSRARTETGLVTRARRPAGRVHDLHLMSTITAAAPYQRERGRRDTALILRQEDLREGIREGRESNLVLFVVDASGSMAARSRMAMVKGAVLSLLLDAYQRRDKVGFVSFRGGSAELVLPPTSSVEAAAARLRVLPTGGRTPLAAGLELAAETLERERLRDPRRRPLLVIVTDGRHTPGADPRAGARLLARRNISSVVVDCENGRIRLGLAGELAVTLGAVLLPLDEMAPTGAGDGAVLASTVRVLRGAA
jgi:magnesium chelatase subunit D